MKQEKNSIAKKVKDWVAEKPFIRRGLKENILNHSAIARKIQTELKIKNFDAILVAIRRYQEEKISRTFEDAIKKILATSTLEIRTGYKIYVLKNKAIPDDLIEDKYTHIIKGSDFITIITDKNIRNEEKTHENVVEVNVRSKKEIEEIPGVHVEILDKLATYDINLLESYSCHTDTVFVIEKKDLNKTIVALEELGIK